MKEQRARERKRGRSRRQERKKKKSFLFSCLTHSWRALWRPRSRGFLFGLRQASIPKYLFLFCVYGAHVALSYTKHSTLYTPSVSLSLSPLRLLLVSGLLLQWPGNTRKKGGKFIEARPVKKAATSAEFLFVFVPPLFDDYFWWGVRARVRL